QARARAHAGGGGDVDEAAPALAAELGHRVDGGQVDAFDVDRVAAVELVLGHVQRGPVAVRPARVVDHGVEPAVVLHGGDHQGLHVGRVRHVGGHEAGPAAGRGDLGRHALAAGGVDVVDDDGRAFLGQPLGDTLADAAAGAGDDDGLVLQTHGWSPCVGSAVADRDGFQG